MLLNRLLTRGRLVFSAATFAELETRLWRPRFDRYITLEQRKLLLHDLDAVAEWVTPGALPAFGRDPDDDKFVHVAQAAGAGWLISGDRDLPVLQQVRDATMLPPAQAMKRLAALGLD